MHDIVPEIIPFVGGLPVWVACIIAAVVIPTLIALNIVIDRWARRRAPWMFGWKPALMMLGLSITVAAVFFALSPPSPEILKAMRQLEVEFGRSKKAN